MNRTILLAIIAVAAVAGRAEAQALAVPRGTSDAERLRGSAEHIARMKGALGTVLARAEEARREKDVVRLNCVTEKLAQVKALLRTAEQADVALHEAAASRDPAADAELARIAIARAKVDGLRLESEQCLGQLAYLADEKTTVEVQQPDLPEESAGTGAAPRRRSPGYPSPPARHGR